LASLAELGVLVSKKRVLESCLTNASVVNDLPIGSTAIATCNRPELAVRCLTDFIESDRKHGRSTDFLVFDDSPDPGIRQQYRDALRSIAKRKGVEILYAGKEEKASFVEALVTGSSTAGLPQRILEFALFGAQELTYRLGANRNASLLHTVGDAFFSVDDDVRRRIAPAPEREDGIAVVSADDPTDLWFFPDRASALGAVEFAGDDPLVQHERLLGRELSTCVAELAASGRLDLDGTSSRLLTTLLSGGGRVRATMTGLVGDCAMGSGIHYLALQGAAHDRLVRSDPGYETLRSTREVLRVVPTWTINEGGLFMTAAAGLDNSALLPPFFPVQRNSDVIFSVTLRCCSEDWLIGHLPWVIEHDPAENRAFRDSPVERVSQTLTPTAVIDFLVSCSRDLVPREPAERLRALGHRLQGLGRVPARDFEEFLRIGHWQRLTEWISRLENTLTIHDESPDSWKDDVQRCIDAARESLLQDDVAPVDLARKCGEGQALAIMQRLTYRFGGLLEHWPDICEAARNLRENGRTLAVPMR
jgi:hypothetical protein